MSQGNFHTTQKLANKFQINMMTIYYYIKAKWLKVYKINKEFRINKKRFSGFLKI